MRSEGEGVVRSGALSLMTSANIMQRLNRRALTGRALGIAVHQHHGYRMHFDWEGASSADSLLTIPSRTFVGPGLAEPLTVYASVPLCERVSICVWVGVPRHVPDLLVGKVDCCRRRLVPTFAPWPEEGRSLEVVKAVAECGVLPRSCVCNITSSAALTFY